MLERRIFSPSTYLPMSASLPIKLMLMQKTDEAHSYSGLGEKRQLFEDKITDFQALLRRKWTFFF